MNTWNQVLSFEKHMCAVPSTIFGVRLSRLIEAFLVRTGLLQLCFLRSMKNQFDWLQELVGMNELNAIIMNLKIIKYYYLGRFTNMAFWEVTFCSVISSNCIVNCEIVIKIFRYSVILLLKCCFWLFLKLISSSYLSDQL